MEGENNAAFIGHVIDINTAQDEFIKTEHSGILETYRIYMVLEYQN